MFSQPIEIKGSFERCSAELWLVWRGETPLVLAEIPTIISPPGNDSKEDAPAPAPIPHRAYRKARQLLRDVLRAKVT